MDAGFLKVYPGSVRSRGDSVYMMADTGEGVRLAVYGADRVLFEGEEKSDSGRAYKLCPLTPANAKVIRKLFDFTNPRSYKGHDVTFGFGDRLGAANPGQIRAIRDLDVFPVLAQQSIRELNLTDRSFDDVLAAAVWAVFREGYEKGYGADGDHLKTHDEVIYALDRGYSMITLDCSAYFRNDYASAPQEEIDARYGELPADTVSTLEAEYLGRSFVIDQDLTITFSASDLRRAVLVYLPAIDHAVSIYDELLKGAGVDYEISIDETLATTLPQSHFFMANELVRRGVEFSGIAPRFVGEFQKGIDYRGDPAEFERDFIVHAKIAGKFGYRISVHSGSDKLSIYPFVSKLTQGRYHVKTAGTHWLEALRVIARYDPGLYREIHAFAMDNLPEARTYYKITEDISGIRDLDGVPDAGLPDYLDRDDARQVLHITFGLILRAKAPGGAYLFRDRIYQFLYIHEAEYIAALDKHIGRHLAALGL